MVRGATARISGGQRTCAMAPAAPPATKRSAPVAVAGSRATAPLSASKAMNLTAVSGAILSTCLGLGLGLGLG